MTSLKRAGFGAIVALLCAAGAHGQSARPGETHVAEDFEALEARLEQILSRLGHLGPERRRGPSLAIEVLGSGSIMPVRDLRGGAPVHLRGSVPAADPLLVSGLPRPLSELIDDLTNGARINGRALRLDDGTAEPVLRFDHAYVDELRISAVDPEFYTPFEITLSVDAETAEVGPFAPERIAMPDRARGYEPNVELRLGSLGLTASALSVEPIVMVRPRGARLSVSEPPVLHLAEADVGPALAAFAEGTRIENVSIRYMRPDGTPALAVTAMHAWIQRVTPDYSGESGVGIELSLEEPGLAAY